MGNPGAGFGTLFLSKLSKRPLARCESEQTASGAVWLASVTCQKTSEPIQSILNFLHKTTQHLSCWVQNLQPLQAFTLQPSANKRPFQNKPKLTETIAKTKGLGFFLGNLSFFKAVLCFQVWGGVPFLFLFFSTGFPSLSRFSFIFLIFSLFSIGFPCFPNSFSFPPWFS